MEGKTAYFSRSEPDKLFIDGVEEYDSAFKPCFFFFQYCISPDLNMYFQRNGAFCIYWPNLY